MTYKYEINMYWSDEDEAFIVSAPELPGCVTDGSTYVDAARAIEEVMGLWINLAKELDWEIPEPKNRPRFIA